MEITIGKRKIGLNHPPYYIADIAANHDGDIERAFSLIELAKEAGADAAKFQNFRAEKIVSDKGFKQLGQLSHQKNWKKSVFETYKAASIPFDWTLRLKEKCDRVGIEYLTSPYDFDAVDFVDNYVSCYKIGSGDITWTDILTYIAQKNKPVLLATGASTFDDVDRAVQIINNINPELVLLQCNTNYTTDEENYKYINLNVLGAYKTKYPDLILGLSDHTKSYSTVLGAIALGARVVEKHFTDDNTRDGPDHHFSMLPSEWAEMVKAGYELFSALGDGIKRIEGNELSTAKIQRRSIYLNCDKHEDDTLTNKDLVALRPYYEEGFAPYEMYKILGKKCLTNLSKGSFIKRSDINA